MRVAVDRVDQIALTQLAEILPQLPLESGYPVPDDQSVIESAAVDFDRSFAVAFEGVLQNLENTDNTWAYRAQEAVEFERERLNAYFAQRERDGDQVDHERAQRLAELESSRPRVIVRVQGVSDLYLPVAWQDGTPRHLAFDMAADYLGRPIPSLR